MGVDGWGVEHGRLEGIFALLARGGRIKRCSVCLCLYFVWTLFLPAWACFAFLPCSVNSSTGLRQRPPFLPACTFFLYVLVYFCSFCSMVFLPYVVSFRRLFPYPYGSSQVYYSLVPFTKSSFLPTLLPCLCVLPYDRVIPGCSMVTHTPALSLPFSFYLAPYPGEQTLPERTDALGGGRW
jgi:hypothetical protein